MKVTKAHTVFDWRGYKNIVIPDGLKVEFLPDAQGGRYVLNENLRQVCFACTGWQDSIMLHDAIHYGIEIHRSQLTEV